MNIKRTEMFDEYKKYCEYYDRVPLGRNTFLDEIKAKGLTIKKIRGEHLFADFQFKGWEDEQFNFEK